MNGIKEELKKYIDTNILPRYNSNIGGHGIEHIYDVINRCDEIIKEFNLDVDKDIIYTIASYHDIGYKQNPDEHEEVSSQIFKSDYNIKKFFDDEQIKVDLSAVPANITKIAFTVTIYEAEARRQNFGQVNNAFVRIYNEATGEELLRYDLGEDFSIETAAVFGELYKNGGEWKFNAIGSGYQGGLAALCANYGVEVE